MELTTLYYFYELCKEMNMTKTSQRLFITQQTLSNHILRLEDELGVKLFIRKPVLSLTYAGEKTLRYAADILKSNREFKDFINEITQEKKGLVRFGGSSFRLNSCLPTIIAPFMEEFPKVEIRFTDTKSENLVEMIKTNDLDYALVLGEFTNSQIVSEPVFSDRVFLSVTDSLLAQYYSYEEIQRIKTEGKDGVHLKTFERLPFCMLYNHLGSDLQACFMEEEFIPKIAFSSTYLEPGNWISFQGLAAGYACDLYLMTLNNTIPKGVNLFPILFHGKEMTQDMYLIHNVNIYPSKHLLRFKEMILEYFRATSKLLTQSQILS